MSLAHERFVAARFNALQTRFKTTVEPQDYRLQAVLRALGTVQGQRILDLGCGKGRFAHHLMDRGAEVVGLDAATGMLAMARLPLRIQGSALRLPIAGSSFDAVCAIDVFQHLPRSGVEVALAEIRRVLRPQGRLVLVDKNCMAMDDQRPWLPRRLVKRVDEWRGLWMYRPGEPVREHWFHPERLRRQLAQQFIDVQVEYLLSPAERAHAIFLRHPQRRLMTLWTGVVPGGVA